MHLDIIIENVTLDIPLENDNTNSNGLQLVEE